MSLIVNKILVLNLPFKPKPYRNDDLKNYENWIKLFSNKVSHVIITPPVERNDVSATIKKFGIKNLTILPVPSFDTCDRWKVGLLHAVENYNFDLLYFWSADFLFNTESEKSARALIDHNCDDDLVVGTIQSSGIKEDIDTFGTVPLLNNWFPDEYKTIQSIGMEKPRSELFRLTRSLSEFLVSKRWYPSEQTINIILQCIWHKNQFKFKSLPLGEIADEDTNRLGPNSIEQIERMGLWLKYMWRDKNADWEINEYMDKSQISNLIVRRANYKLLSQIDGRYMDFVSDESYRFICDNSWKDIHHSRNQDWTALGVVFAVHIGIFKMFGYLKDELDKNFQSEYYIIGGLIGMLICGFGYMISKRHKNLMTKKLSWIKEAEKRIGLLHDNNYNPDGIVKLQPDYGGIRINILIMSLYVILGLIDLYLAVTFSRYF